MRRFLASLVLAVFSFTLMPAVLFAASADSDLPACCRKDGKHKCAMAEMVEDGGAKLRGISQCPMFPSRTAGTVASNVVGVPVPLKGVPVCFAAVLSSAEQADAQYRVSFSRSRQKRGPPSASSF